MTNDLISNSDLTRDQLINLVKILQEENEIMRSELKQKSFSPEERICVDQLRILLDRSEVMELSLDDARKFEIFHKNLRMVRGQVIEVEKGKKQKNLSNEELMLIVGSES